MGLNRSFEVLSTVIERVEGTGWGVRNVETDCAGDDGRLRATMVLARPRCASGTEADTSALQPTGASITPDGSLRVEYDSEDLPLVDGRPGVTTSIRRVEVEDGDLSVTQRVVIEPEGAPREARADRPASGTPAEEAATASENGTGAPGPSGDGADGESPSIAASVRDESLPAYEDHAYLEALYEACDTFAEMRAAIDMDVSAETVRRYMIDAGVHDPASYESTGSETAGQRVSTGGEGSGIEPAGGQPGRAEPVITEDQLRTDGVGLPADLALTEVVEAIANARSIYEVSQALGLDQDRARSLLRQLGCLDLVSYRLSDVHERTTSYEDVARRIREGAPGRA